MKDLPRRCLASIESHKAEAKKLFIIEAFLVSKTINKVHAVYCSVITIVLIRFFQYAPIEFAEEPMKLKTTTKL